MTELTLFLAGAVTGGVLGVVAERAVRLRGNASGTMSPDPESALLIPGVVAITTGGLWAGLVDTWTAASVPVLTAAAIVVAAALADLRGRIVPNEIVGAGAVVGAGLWIASEGSWSVVWTTVGVGAGLLLLRALSTRWIGQPGIGMGDVKLMLTLSLCLGPGALWAGYLGVVGAAVMGGGARLLGYADRRAQLPFAPFLAAGCILHWTVFPVTAVFSSPF